MTEAEYTAINARIAAMFPTLGQWFAMLPPDAKQAQRDRRRAALAGLEARDVEAAIMAIANGPECPWAGFGQEEWASAHIARRARELSDARAVKREAATLTKRKRVGGGEHSLLDLLAKLKDAQKQPDYHAGDAQALLDAWIPTTGDDKRDTYRCLECLDTGLVTVVSTLRRYGDRWTHSTAVACCPECDAGARMANTKTPPARYDANEHAKIRLGATDAEACAAVDALLKRREEAKRVTAFDTFNERGV